MARVSRLAVLAMLCGAGVGSSLVACNALTGVSSLGTCTDDCAALMAGSEGGSGSEGGVGSEGGTPGVDAGPQLPLTCTGNETACAGTTLGQCMNGMWLKTTCPELCLNGKCDSWPSCRNAAGTGCGVGAGTSCCETALVPGGMFSRRNGFGGLTNATVSPFALDKYEVTVGRMRAFVDAGGGVQATAPALGAGANPHIAGSGWHTEWNVFLPANGTTLRTSFAKANGTWTDAPGAHEHLPINNVSWFVASAFCAWDGGRLPTYAELNFAGAGGSEQRQYPWSSSPNDNTITISRAAYNCAYTAPAKNCPSSYCSDSSSTPCDTTTCVSPASCVYPSCTGCAFSDIAPVGALPTGAGKWGHFDLSGNVAELVVDVDGLLMLPCMDCARLPPVNVHGPQGNPRLDTNFLVVAGSWDGTAASLHTSSFTTTKDDLVDSGIGFRCVR